MASSGAERSIEPVRLAHFPIAFFTVVMGLSGLAIMWTKASHGLGRFGMVANATTLLALTTLVLVTTIYIVKMAVHGDHVRAEWNHPVKINFAPAFSISLILASILVAGHAPPVGERLFLVAASLQLVFTLAVLGEWLTRPTFQIGHVTPAWFIPVVGNVLVPVAGVPFGYVELSWFFFAIGIGFWMPLFSLVFWRIAVGEALPERLAPTIFILIAPPAVSFLAYVALAGAIDGLARILYYFALFLALFCLFRLPKLLRLRFFLSWWALSFPLAAVTTASWVMADRLGLPAHHWIAVGLLAFTSFVIALLFARTLIAILRREICVPE